MGTINLSNNGEVQNLALNGLEDTLQGAAAWIYFNGSGTVAINDSFNVSSLTDNGTGDYTISFTNNMDSANYAVCGSSHIWNTYLAKIRAVSLAVGSVQIESGNSAKRDSSWMHTIIFGKLA